MLEKAWFKDWFNSPYYHKLYFERDENEARQFILKLLELLNPAPNSFMLDVACGRGRHSHLLAKSGFQVTGIDISKESIDFANLQIQNETTEENKRLEFYQHDMRLPFRVNYYDYVFNFFTSFGYFNTRREHDDSIRTMAACLKPNGILIIDYLNVHYTEDSLIPNEIKNVGNTSYEIHRWQDELHFYKKIIIKDPELLYPIEHTEKVAKFSLGDFNEMLGYHGLQIQEVFGDYQLNHYHIKNKPRLILLAKKIH